VFHRPGRSYWPKASSLNRGSDVSGVRGDQVAHLDLCNSRDAIYQRGDFGPLQGRLTSPEQFENVIVREAPDGGTVRVLR